MKWIYILYWVIIMKDPQGHREKVVYHQEYNTRVEAEYWEYKKTHEGNNKAVRTWIDSSHISHK